MSNEQENPQFSYVPSVWPSAEGVQVDGLLESTTPLSEEQDARVSAVYHARAALESRGGPMGPASQTRPPKVEDLLAVARWIMEGGTDGDT